MDFRVVREKLRLSQPDIATVVKKAYPGFDVPLVSKVERSHLYGVTFTSGAKKVISNELPDMAKALGWRKDANRTLPGKIPLDCPKMNTPACKRRASGITRPYRRFAEGLC